MDEKQSGSPERSDDNLCVYPYGDIDPDVALRVCVGKGLREVVIIGEQQDGSLYVGSSTSNKPLINWLLDLAKKEMTR